jgi:lipopolysaccharide transport system ATP-binding protein
MSEVVVKVENLSKQYRLGQVGTGTLKDDFKRWRYQLMGKDDPFITVGEENDRTKKSNTNYVWALKDINFEVAQGEILGVIGKNGAGKSTLLKILSRTTGPTTGSIKMKGRVASLLEVGTGFHGELSGRENIFLNGAIMGMDRSEIKKKLDEIVHFAGVEKYIDTPVKRYSSGMYVRLAFAVAAHLEPDILIVDEVLAVGDADFQKKAITKIQQVSRSDGRTILFVSHNMSTMQKLCNTGILLGNGSIQFYGNMRDTIENYLIIDGLKSAQKEFQENYTLKTFVKKIVIEDNVGKICNEIPIGKGWTIKIYFKVNQLVKNLVAAIGITNQFDVSLNTSWQKPFLAVPGDYCAEFKENQIFYAVGHYKFNIGLSDGMKSIQYLEHAASINIIPIVDEISDTVLKYDSETSAILNPMSMKSYKI